MIAPLLQAGNHGQVRRAQRAPPLFTFDFLLSFHRLQVLFFCPLCFAVFLKFFCFSYYQYYSTGIILSISFWAARILLKFFCLASVLPMRLDFSDLCFLNSVF